MRMAEKMGEHIGQGQQPEHDTDGCLAQGSALAGKFELGGENLAQIGARRIVEEGICQI